MSIASQRSESLRIGSTIPAASARRVAGMLVLRLALFAGFQILIAGLLAVAGTADPWAASAAWWPLAASAVNLVNLAVLARLARSEGFRLGDLYRPVRTTWTKDLAVAGVVTLIGVPLAALPSFALLTVLFGDPQRGFDLFVQPLPLWAAGTAVILFPLTTALAEMPTYYGYVQPRLAMLTRSWWPVVLLPAVFHALQHAALPVIFNPAFITWRALMFVPFVLLISPVLRRRPSVLPYLLVVHFLLDAQTALMLLAVAR